MKLINHICAKAGIVLGVLVSAAVIFGVYSKPKEAVPAAFFMASVALILLISIAISVLRIADNADKK